VPESEQHMKLVRTIREWIEINYRSEKSLFVWSDLPESQNFSKPLSIEGFIPDIYAKTISSQSRIIIGEAKTSRDLDRPHTEQQLIAYLKYCSLQEYSYFILAVPWDYVRYARSLLNDLILKNSFYKVETIILEPAIICK
jgi:hypothetical protein